MKDMSPRCRSKLNMYCSVLDLIRYPADGLLLRFFVPRLNDVEEWVYFKKSGNSALLLSTNFAQKYTNPIRNFCMQKLAAAPPCVELNFP